MNLIEISLWGGVNFVTENSGLIFASAIVLCLLGLAFLKSKSFLPKDALRKLNSGKIKKTDELEVVQNGVKYQQVNFVCDDLRIEFWYDYSNPLNKREEILINTEGFHPLRIIISKSAFKSWSTGANSAFDLDSPEKQKEAALELYNIIKEKFEESK